MKRELLDNGNIWQKSDGRWIGLVRYKDEFGETQRKSFSSKKKKTLQAKRKPLKESMKNWLRVYKYPEVERTTYDRYECTAEDYCLVSLPKERKRYSRPHKIYGNSRGC